MLFFGLCVLVYGLYILLSDLLGFGEFFFCKAEGGLSLMCACLSFVGAL